MDEKEHQPSRIAELCPAAIEMPGLRMPCPCADYAEKLGEPPPEDDCPARETLAEMRERHRRELAKAHAATIEALHDVSRAIRDAETRAEALEALRHGRSGG